MYNWVYAKLLLKKLFSTYAMADRLQAAMKPAEAKRCGTTLDVAMHILTAWSVLEGLHYSLNP